MEISQKYSPADIESGWYAYWEERGFFRSIPDGRKPYTIVIPPPNVTGMLHMGHMLNNTIQDVLIRRKRKQGFNACWVPGTDHASIATEAKVVRMLREEHGLKKSDLSRQDFLKHAYAWKEKYGGIILTQLRKLGASCDWDRTRFTMDDDYYKAVISVFCDLHKKGHIYRGLRMVHWDPAGQTALSDEEVIYKEINGKLYHVRYLIKDTDNQYLTVATTRPETILGDTAISVHPEDSRYSKLVGKKCFVPLIQREIPIISDSYVDREFGTGCLKVTPAHDLNDYEIGQRHKLETIEVLNPDGTMSQAAQLYIGLDRFAARKKITADLESAGHLVKVEEHRHSVGHSERTDAVVERRLSMQWWLRMSEISKPAFAAVMEDSVNLIPPKFKNTYRHWMENILDWCISRQLWWGQRIPAWYLVSEKELPEASRQIFVALTAQEALELAKNSARGSKNLQEADLWQDPDVLDTWFSSWLWPFQVFCGITNPGNAEVNYYYPTNDLVTGPDILFFWVARMLVAGYEYQREKPFQNVYLTGLIRDRKGRKMSKSLGNSPDPLELIALYGADGVRVGVLLSSPAGNDLVFDTPLDMTKEPLNSKLCEQGRNFANKMWNAFRLVRGWEAGGNPESGIEMIANNWMSSRLEEVRIEIEEHFEKFRISEALMATYKLIWDDFCSWYLELIKPAKGETVSQSAIEKARGFFEDLMELAHPFMPFITEEIWQEIKPRKEGESIMISRSKECNPDLVNAAILESISLIRETITALRSFRVENGYRNSQELNLTIKTNRQLIFEHHEAILRKLLNTVKLNFTSESVAGAAGVRVQTHEFFIVSGGKLNLEEEISKINTDIAYTEGFLASVNKKLLNPKFIENASPEVIGKEEKKREDAELKLKMLGETLRRLRGK